MASEAWQSEAKVGLPRVGTVLRRERLHARLDALCERPLVWIDAAGGSGKSTLVADYLDARERPALWLEVDESDEDVASFFHYFSLAVEEASRSKAPPLLPLTSEYAAGLQQFARRYFETVFSRLPEGSCVVLDNLHTISERAPLHAVLLEALGRLPAGGNVLAISRIPPPVAYARLQANRTMARLGARELRLSTDDVAAMATLRGVELVDGDSERIVRLTDGWAAGVQLVLERLARGGATGVEEASSLAQADIFDILAGAVFDQQPVNVQSFLLRTAHLASVTPQGASHLTGHPHPEQLLAELHRNNLFTDRRTHAQAIYHYHPLLRSFLRRRAEAELEAGELQELRHTAAELEAAAGRLDDAAALYCGAEDWPGLRALITREAPALLAQGRGQTLERWIGRLPPEVVTDAPWILYWRGVVRLGLRPVESRGDFERALAQFEAQRDVPGAYQAWAALVQTFTVEWDDLHPLDRWIAYYDELVSRFGEPSPGPAHDAVTTSMFAALVYRQPRHPEMSRWRTHAEALIVHGAHPGLRMMTAASVMLDSIWNGNTAGALRCLGAVQDLGGAESSAPAARVWWTSMEAIYQWYVGDYAACLETVERGVALARNTGAVLGLPQLLAHGIYGAVGTGDVALGERYLAEVQAMLAGAPVGRVHRAHALHLAAMLEVRRGDYAAAEDLLREGVEVLAPLGAHVPEAMSRCGLVAVLARRGQLDAARAELERVEPLAETLANLPIAYTAALLRADLDGLSGERRAQRESLRRAFDIGIRAGSPRPLWWDDELAEHVYRAALEFGIEVKRVSELIHQSALAPVEPPVEVEGWPWLVKIFALGRFDVVLRGESIVTQVKAQSKPLELLRLLVALGGRGVGDAQVAEALWPDADAGAARQALATTLHRLRKLLGAHDSVHYESRQLSLDERLCWVDTWALERRMELLEPVLRRAQAGIDELVLRGQEVWALYRGPFLEGGVAEAWAAPMRQRLRRRVQLAVGLIGQRLEEQGAWREAAAIYEAGIEAEPGVEAYYHSLMRDYLHLGERSAAMAVYERCRAYVVTTLGREPGRDIEHLRKVATPQRGALRHESPRYDRV